MYQMPLRQRQQRHDDDEEEAAETNPYDDNKTSKTGQQSVIQETATRRIFRYSLLLLLLLVLLAVAPSQIIVTTSNSSNKEKQREQEQDDAAADNVVIIRRNLSPNNDEAMLILTLANAHQQHAQQSHPKEGGGGGGEEGGDNNKTVVVVVSSLGQVHRAKVEINNKNNAMTCQNPRSRLFAIRLTGDALVYVHLQEEADIAWFGSFTLPIAGSYALDARWYGCQDQEAVVGTTEYRYSSPFLALKEAPVHIQVMNDNNFTIATPTKDDDDDDDDSIFTPGAAWISTKSMQMDQTKKSLYQYIWTDPNRLSSSSSFIEIKNALVSKQGTARTKEGFYEVSERCNSNRWRAACGVDISFLS
jgi:hypothetical protein